MNLGAKFVRRPSRNAPPLRPELAPPNAAAWGGKLLLLVFLLTIFEGALRKWVVGGTPALRYLAYFSKDIVFVIAALAGAGVHRRWQHLALGVLLPISVALLLGPTLVNLPHSNAVGLLLSGRSYVLIPVCAFLAAGTIRSLRDVDRIAYVVGACAIAIAALGVRQYSLPATHFLNRYEVAEDVDVHIVAEFGHVRATGTFAFISGMIIMSGLASWAGMYLFLSGTNLGRRLFAVAVVAASVVCALVSMSRGAIFLCALTVGGAVMLYGRIREVFYVGLLVLVGGWTLFGGSDPGDQAADPGLQAGLAGRFSTADTVSERAGYMLMNIQLGLTQDPLGHGLGVGQVGGNYAAYGKWSWGGGYETEVGRIIFEVGVVGFLGVMLWRLVAIFLMGRQLRSADSNVRAMLAPALPFYTYLAVNQMSFNHTGLAAAWAVFAAVFGVTCLRSTAAPNTSARPATTALSLRQGQLARQLRDVQTGTRGPPS
jgi:hypothetical protein